MSRKETLTNITDVLGFVYDADTLPTAVIDFSKAAGCSFVISVHSLREGNEGLLKKCFEAAGMDYDKDFEATGLRFWEDYRDPSHSCYGMYYGFDEGRRIRNIEEWGVKSHEMCA